MSEPQPFSAEDPLADPAVYALQVSAELATFLESPAAGSLVWARSAGSRRLPNPYDSYAATRYERTTAYTAEVDGWGSVVVSRVDNERHRSTTYITVVTGPGGDELGRAASDAAGSVPCRAFEGAAAAWQAQQLRAARGILRQLGGELGA